MKSKEVIATGLLCCIMLSSVLSSCNTVMEHGEGTGRDNALFDSGDSSGNNGSKVVHTGVKFDISGNILKLSLIHIFP